MTKSDDHAEDDRYYGTILATMWDQYFKVSNVSFLIAAGFFGALITIIKEHLGGSYWLIAAIVAAIITSIAVMLWRIISQILMERQVYGDFDRAQKYFQRTGGAIPKALKGATPKENKEHILRLEGWNKYALGISIGFGLATVILSGIAFAPHLTEFSPHSAEKEAIAPSCVNVTVTAPASVVVGTRPCP